MTGKTIALSRWTFVGKVTCLLFNMPSRLVIAFLPRNKCLLISWLQSLSAVILEPTKLKSVTVYIFTPSIEREECKSRLKTQHSKNKHHGIWFHHFKANRWGNNADMQGDNIQSCCTPFPILNQFVVPCPILIVAS